MELKDKELLFSILKAGLKDESLDLSSLNVDSDLMRIIKEQTFQPFLYHVSRDSRFKADYIASYLVIENFEKKGAFLKKLFDEEGIDHVFLKGYELRNLYPDKLLRLSGDIDILVRLEDYEKAKKLLEDNNFKFDSESSHHAGYYYKGTEIELHRIVINEDNKFISYFRNAFNYVKHIDNHTYSLESEFHFCYILAHYIKHLVGGAGLRELLDVYIMLEKLNLDINKVNLFLEEYNLKEFFNTVLNELYILFGYDKLPFVKNDAAYDLIDYSINSGIHGFGEDSDYSVNRQKNLKSNKIKYLLKSLFVPLKTMFSFYPWTKSIILLPLGYVVRFFDLLLRSRKKLIKVLDSKDDKLFTRIGLEDYK